MNKTIFKKIFVVAAIAIITTSFLSCHPDGPEEFIDYVYDAGDSGHSENSENQDENDWSYPTSKPNQLWDGSGSSYSPYIIKTKQDLANLAYMVNNGNSYSSKYFKLGNNIDLNYRLSVTSSSSNAKQWTSIGSSSYPFKGNFDGNNYTIDGLYKNSLFGSISNGSVQNLTMGTGYIIYDDYNNAGAIAQRIYKTTISNCTNNGTIVSTYNGNAGGIVGSIEDSEISYSYNHANTTMQMFLRLTATQAELQEIWKTLKFLIHTTMQMFLRLITTQVELQDMQTMSIHTALDATTLDMFQEAQKAILSGIEEIAIIKMKTTGNIQPNTQISFGLEAELPTARTS